jgi:hypothetical protein
MLVGNKCDETENREVSYYTRWPCKPKYTIHVLSQYQFQSIQLQWKVTEKSCIKMKLNVECFITYHQFLIMGEWSNGNDRTQ